MKKQIKLEDATGKTVEAVEWDAGSGQVIITFTEGTFSLLGAHWGYEDPILKESKYTWDEFSQEKAIALGIITKDEANRLKAEEAAAYRKSREISERHVYEELKKKFEGQ